MNTIVVSAKTFRSDFPKYQELVEKGVSITVLKRSKPIFRLEPIDTEFEKGITDALMDYENKNNSFASYDDVFKK